MTLAMGREERKLLSPTATGPYGAVWRSDPPEVWEVTLTHEGVDHWTQIEPLPGPQAVAMGQAMLAAGCRDLDDGEQG
ncbi:hypothetical protein [Actinomycetospora termitidis]|uniref:Uncharacterized protein n=1 Tax=Actinomycetospora termitidis TaxID=3053470 RepID=A0ABT7MFJ7_9PSEU|nr:hypothetical protein [Actinomycetospora sp. Odt1-22]MDL5159442.1 hypothetical protein [Actinomycetospora sp. Odt1-22]